MNKEIAEALGRSKSTIGRELERNWGYGAWWYKHDRAQELNDKRRKASTPLTSEKTWQKVFELFNEDLSSEQISGALKLQGAFASATRQFIAGFMRKSKQKHKGIF